MARSQGESIIIASQYAANFIGKKKKHVSG